MSEDNVELTLRIADAFNRRDVALGLWDEEGVWYPAIEALTEGRRASLVNTRLANRPRTALECGYP
jgi:hypothetical protein